MATSSDSEPSSRTLPSAGRLARLAGIGILSVAALGCGEAQVSAEHRDLVLRLATGASTHDQAIIDRAATDVVQLEADHALTDAEAEAFHSILEAASAGDWDRAQQLAYALRDGQHPTAEDQERVAKRTLPPIKKVGAHKPGH
ncbi:hypothetical protein V5E97_14955 [Singulisphaera sp. Ch08]|uniref:DUF4398 domain-containing protein n=1 Tax=Singulisphaera sp. Ch08 TaxID=3120278 RepID=A0AAU7CQ95_9BACT